MNLPLSFCFPPFYRPSFAPFWLTAAASPAACFPVSVFGWVPGPKSKQGYLSPMFLLYVGEDGGIGEIGLPTGAFVVAGGRRGFIGGGIVHIIELFLDYITCCYVQ